MVQTFRAMVSSDNLSSRLGIKLLVAGLNLQPLTPTISLIEPFTPAPHQNFTWAITERLFALDTTTLAKLLVKYGFRMIMRAIVRNRLTLFNGTQIPIGNLFNNLLAKFLYVFAIRGKWIAWVLWPLHNENVTIILNTLKQSTTNSRLYLPHSLITYTVYTNHH